MKFYVHKDLVMRLSKNKKHFLVYLNSKLIIKQEVLHVKQNDVAYTFLYMLHMLIRLGLVVEKD